jgi:hypothetical protein
MGSNPTQAMDNCVCLFCVCVDLCVGSGIAMASSLVQGVLPSAKNDYEIADARAQQKAVKPLMMTMISLLFVHLFKRNV